MSRGNFRILEYRNLEKACVRSLFAETIPNTFYAVFNNCHCITMCSNISPYSLRPIDNLAEQVLVIEVWDSDEATVGVSEIKGAKGFGM